MQIINGSKIASLVRGLARVDSKGNIIVPAGIMKAMELKNESVVELRFIGGKEKKLILSKIKKPESITSTRPI
jgi:bifunctional DNA-binding transcriptional regulator/antitoxin component of YhaV-PrlF toxin-antitoxin module